jgi:hypothetical protein
MENHPDAAATQDANKIGIKKKRVYGENGRAKKERGWSHAGSRCSVGCVGRVGGWTWPWIRGREEGRADVLAQTYNKWTAGEERGEGLAWLLPRILELPCGSHPPPPQKQTPGTAGRTSSTKRYYMPSGRKDFLPHLRVRSVFRENQRKGRERREGKGEGKRKRQKRGQWNAARHA